MKIIAYLDQSMQRSMSSSAHQLFVFGAIVFFGFPLSYWIWTQWFVQPFETWWLRLLGSLLGLGLMLAPYWPLRLKPMLPWYWFLTLLYTLPFFATYYFLMSDTSDVSAMSLLCSTFLLVLLVDFLSLSILFVLGVGMALLGYYLTAKHAYLGQEHIEMGLVLLFVIIAGSTLNYKTAMIQQQRLAGMAAAAGMIAHELRTPLLGIKSGAMALSKYLPLLFNAYQLAKQQGLIAPHMEIQRMGRLQKVSERIVSETDFANTIIDMLLMKAGRENSLKNCELELCSMADCLQEALDRYPFPTEKARGLVTWQGDFQFMGSKLLMQHVLFNLLKNALYMIATMQRGEITIWSEQGEQYEYLYFMDTAKGMSAKQLSRLFDHFYTTTFMGTGIGLSFCKLVMLRFGGDITCESVEGEYTKFTLSFPMA